MLKNEKNILLIVLIVGILHLVYLIYFHLNNSYLPAPFVVEKFDTFMDFYNTLYWSQNSGIYTLWGSIYPPLNFIVLDFIRYLYLGDLSGIPLTYRDMTQDKIFGIIFFYVICLLISVRLSYKDILKIKYQLIIFLIFMLSPPFLFTLERGNLLILCLPVLSIYASKEYRVYKPIALALLINLKPYFLVLYLIEAFSANRKNKKNFFILTPIYSTILFLSTGLYLGEEHYLLPINLVGFAGSNMILNPQNILAFPSSVIAFTFLKKIIPNFTLVPYIAYTISMILYYYMYKFIRLILSGKVLDEDYLTIFGIIFITNYSVTSGGYSLLFYIPMLANLYKRKLYKQIFVVGLIFTGLFDLIPIYINVYQQEEIPFLSNAEVDITQNLNLSSIVNPFLNLYFLIMMFNHLSREKNDEMPS